MTEAWRSISITEFEHVLTGPAQSLLRVGGRGPTEDGVQPRPVLVVETAAVEARFDALSAPEDRSGVMRAAYAVPTTLVSDHSRYRLQTPTGATVQLPAPTPGTGRRRDPSPPAVSVQEAEARAAEAESRVHGAEQAAQLAESRIASLELELSSQAPTRDALRQEVAALQSRQRNLERELDESRDQLRLMTFERDELSRQAAAFDAVAVKARERAAASEAAHAKTTSTLNELQLWRGEIERRLADTTSELSAVRATRDADERELTRMRTALAEHERAASGG